MPLPEALAKAPRLLEGLHFYYEAFWELDSDRHVGMAVGRIPWTSVNEYARRHRLTDDEFDVLLHHIREMDTVYLDVTSPKKDEGPRGGLGAK